MIEPRLLLRLEAPDSAAHLDPGFRPRKASLRLRERAGDGECGSAGHLFPIHRIAHLRAARADRLRGDRDIGRRSIPVMVRDRYDLKAAQQGNTDAETNVGAIYLWGIGYRHA